MQRILLSTLVIAGIATTATAQKGVVGAGSTQMLIIDPSGAGSIQQFGWAAGAGQSRGHMMGPGAQQGPGGGLIYNGAWSTNGIDVLDYVSKPPVWTSLVKDTTNYKMGAPYQPALDLDFVGGPGILCIDGNPSAASSTNRNLFRVDIRNKTFSTDAFFPNTLTPMSDFYRNPYVPGEFLGVGFATSDYKILRFKVEGSNKIVTPPTLATLTKPCMYDALIHEDQKLYCWTSSATFTGFQVVNLLSKTVVDLPVTGMAFAGAGYAAVWPDPPEVPGRFAYVLQEAGATDVLWKVNLSTNPATAVKLTLAPPAGAYNTARSTEEAQLISWKSGTAKPFERVFSLEFGPQQGPVPRTYMLFPCIVFRYATSAIQIPAHLGGGELWVVPDPISVDLAWNNILPGAVGTTVGRLPQNGQVEVKWDIGGELGFPCVWAAFAVQAGKIVDISNPIMVKI